MDKLPDFAPVELYCSVGQHRTLEKLRHIKRGTLAGRYICKSCDANPMIYKG